MITRSGRAPQSPCNWARLTLHPSGNLGDRLGLGARLMTQAGCDGFLPPWHPLAGPGGSLRLCRPSGIQGKLRRVNPPKYFCALSETLTDVANALLHTSLPVPSYGVISEIPETVPSPPHTIDIPTHINCYMGDVITAVQGGPDRQCEVFDSTVRALKWFFHPCLAKPRIPSASRS